MGLIVFSFNASDRGGTRSKHTCISTRYLFTVFSAIQSLVNLYYRRPALRSYRASLIQLQSIINRTCKIGCTAHKEPTRRDKRHMHLGLYIYIYTFHFIFSSNSIISARLLRHGNQRGKTHVNTTRRRAFPEIRREAETRGTCVILLEASRRVLSRRDGAGEEDGVSRV